MRSCLPQGNLSVEEEFKLFGELPAHYIHMNAVVHTASLISPHLILQKF